MKVRKKNMKKHKYVALALTAILSLNVTAFATEPNADSSQTEQKVEQTENKENIEIENQKAENPETDNQEQSAEEPTSQQTQTTKKTLQPAWAMAENAPAVTAGAAILIEPETGTILYEKNAKDKMYPASMTKIMTALVTMDYLKPEEKIVVGTEVNEISLDSSKAGHKAGETVTVENVLRGLLIPSGNDSANVLASAVAKKVKNDTNMNFAKCEAIFVDLMNKKAQDLGAVNTHFNNAHGYHDENHYSSAYDMALFSTEFMQNEILMKIAGERSFIGNGAGENAGENPDVVTQEYSWGSHNLLITDNEYQYPYATGIKTGFTNEAGDCVSASAEKDGRKLISVVFNAADPARWQESAALFEYGFNNYAPIKLTEEGDAIAELPLTKQNKLQGDKVSLTFNDAMVAYLPTEAVDRIEKTIQIKEEYLLKDKDGTEKVKAPLKKGDEIATVIYQIDGKEVAQKAAYAGADVEKATIFNNIQYYVKQFFSNLFSVKGLIGIAIVVVVVALVILILRHLRGGRHRRGGYSFKRNSRRRRNRW